MIEIKECEPITRHQQKLGMLEYGTVFKSPCQPNSLYMKVNKRKLGNNVEMRPQCSKGHSVALNLKLGTLRQIDGDKTVTVYDSVLEIRPTEKLREHMKDHCY